MFQKIILRVVEGAICYVDDILVSGDSEEEHLQYTEEVLNRLQAHGVRLKKSKCYFLKDSVVYLGHMVDAKGIQALPEKIAAVEKAPLPQNVRFFGDWWVIIGNFFLT